MSIAEQRAQQVVPIVMTESNTPFVTILQKEGHEAHKTLGCYKAIDGNEYGPIKYLPKTKAANLEENYTMLH
jgi:hypothetical protein